MVLFKMRILLTLMLAGFFFYFFDFFLKIFVKKEQVWTILYIGIFEEYLQIVGTLLFCR